MARRVPGIYRVQVRGEAMDPSCSPALQTLFSVTVCTLENTSVVGSKFMAMLKEIWVEFNRICQ